MAYLALKPRGLPPISANSTALTGRWASTLLHEFSRRALRVGESVLLVCFLGLVLGYLVFYTVFPNVSVPATGNLSLLSVLGALFGSAVLVGLLTENLGQAVLQGFAAIPLGATVASAMALSPLLTGILVAQSSDIVFVVVRLGLPVFLFALVINIIGIVVGLAIREALGLSSRSSRG